MKTDKESHAFSVELKHKKHLKTIAIPSNGNGSVVVEGFLLETHGVNGCFRIDLEPEEAHKLFNAVVKEVK